MIQFIEETHKYLLDGKELISVTTLMQKHGLAPNYNNVKAEVLRAKAERGTMIHKEIEDYIKDGSVGFTAELVNFINYNKVSNTEVLKSEFILHNDIVAGTADLLLYNEGYIIGDIKTTAVLHKEAVSWQLSIYAYLLMLVNPSITITKGQAYHFNKEGVLNVVDIQLKPMDEIERLLEAERNGELFKQTSLVVNEEDLLTLCNVEALIKHYEDKKKAAENQAKTLRAAIMEAMEKQGLKKFENDQIILTYVEPTTRTSIDSAKLKKDMPQIAEQYTKTTDVKASLRITLKED